MNELLKIIEFNMKLERFAEVFGDDIEMGDINGFFEVCPFPADFEGVNLDPIKKLWAVNTPDYMFYALDMATQNKLNELREAEGFEPADIQLLEAYFRFVNDCFLWDDISDLERWEEDLFNSLDGVQQKNYKPLTLAEDYASRSALLDTFLYYIRLNYGDAVASDCVQLLSDYFGEFVTIQGGF